MSRCGFARFAFRHFACIICLPNGASEELSLTPPGPPRGPLPSPQALSEDPDACALLMFPTKALAQDQMRALQGLLRAAFGPAGPTVAVCLGAMGGGRPEYRPGGHTVRGGREEVPTALCAAVDGGV